MNTRQSEQQFIAANTGGKGFTPNTDNKTKGDRQPTHPSQYDQMQSTARTDGEAMGSAIALTNQAQASSLQTFLQQDERFVEETALLVSGRIKTRAQRVAQRVVELLHEPSPTVSFEDIFAAPNPIDVLLAGDRAIGQIGEGK